MNAQELRIGNYVNWVDRKSDARILNLADFNIVCDSLNNNEPYFKPIPLTEERLLEFGFEIKDKNYSLNVGGELFRYAIKDGFVIWKTHRNLWQMNEYTNNYTQYEYIHQLQNLYFALTGEELTIKE